MTNRETPGSTVAGEELRRVALLVEYDGARYHGFQRQSNASSIQAALEEAILRLTGETRRTHGAGRTDAGVHAWGQVVAFDTWSTHPTTVFLHGLNHHLPEDISVRNAAQVPLDFDPRRTALSREYRYQLLNSSGPSPLLGRYTHLVQKPLDEDAMNAAARSLEGERDFSPFAGPMVVGSRQYSRRMLHCSVTRQGEMVTLEMVADGFLAQQVRRTAGALLDVGLGRMSLPQFSAVAGSGVRGAARNTLPAKGLALVSVRYATNPFLADEATSLSNSTLLEVGAI